MASYSPVAAGPAGAHSQSCGYSVPTPPWQCSCSPGDRPAAAGGPAMSMTEGNHVSPVLPFASYPHGPPRTENKALFP